MFSVGANGSLVGSLLNGSDAGAPFENGSDPKTWLSGALKGSANGSASAFSSKGSAYL